MGLVPDRLRCRELNAVPSLGTGSLEVRQVEAFFVQGINIVVEMEKVSRHMSKMVRSAAAFRA
jgi:hypothetical protein